MTSRIHHIMPGFQSTPPHGGRRCFYRGGHGNSEGFNPRPRTGGDCPVGRVTPAQCVSIHAPARGATAALQALSGHRTGFNPRPRTGGDPGQGEKAREYYSFNPRPRTGGDHYNV